MSYREYPQADGSDFKPRPLWFAKRFRKPKENAHAAFDLGEVPLELTPTEDEEVAKMFARLDCWLPHIIKTPNDQDVRPKILSAARDLAHHKKLSDDLFFEIAAALYMEPAALEEYIGKQSK